VKRAEEYPAGDFRRTDPRYQGGNFDVNMRAAAAVRELAAVPTSASPFSSRRVGFAHC
jgi:hypothetical protein